MAVEPRKKESSSVHHFFLNGDLHKILWIDRHANLVECHRYRDKTLVVYVWSDVKRDSQRAFRLHTVARMLNCHKDTLRRHIERGNITNFCWRYMGERKERIFSEDDVIDAWEFLKNIHQGRPRKDGRIQVNKALPTKGELLAMLRKEEILYYWDSDVKKFMPVWRPKSLG